MSNVSVVLATYNGERHLGAQLQSIAWQTKQPHEVIVCDDGSSDRTLEIVREFAGTAPFPVIVRENPSRLGYGENFLQAARLASGTFIAFCDQDDVWHKEKLERCTDALCATQALMCAHTATLIDGQSNYIGFFSQGITRGQVCPPLTLPPWKVFFGFSQVFRRELIEVLDPEQRGADNHDFSQKLAHDRWIYFLAGSLGSTVTLAHPLVAYRQHGKNVFGGMEQSISVRMRRKLTGSAISLRQHMALAFHRSQLMQDLARRPASPWSSEAKAAAEYWQALGHSFAARAELYETAGIANRLSLFRTLVKQGLYDQRDGIGRPLLLKDFVLGSLQMTLVPPPSERSGVEKSARVEERL
ncbi:glycosyltransferase [Terrihabitans sp. B22-R8]|uniref:glycosyltransferase n=1 Tax=Terrihabitans sp. B22-R8 TaxID=3425128 RepID=UPI00403CDE1D